MADLPANGQWAIYSMQKTLPILGQAGGVLGAHNYIALVNPEGNIIEEMHGVYTKAFTVGGADAGNYLKVQNWGANDYIGQQSVTSSKLVTSGTEDQMRSLYNTGYQATAAALDKNHELYDGAKIFGHAVNSNSVWYTSLSAMGVKDVSELDGPESTPGNHTDLRKIKTNNEWFGRKEDPWSANPDVGIVYHSKKPDEKSELGPENNKSFAAAATLLQNSGMSTTHANQTQHNTDEIIDSLKSQSVELANASEHAIPNIRGEQTAKLSLA